MKRQLKRLLCAFLAVLMLCAAMPMGFSLPSFAATNENGLIFRQQLIHWLDKPLETAPVTFSATVKIATDVETKNARAAGVIFGNYDAKETGSISTSVTTEQVYSYVNFEIFEGGVPGLSFMNAEGTVTTLLFDEYDARTGEFVTLTVVFKQGESASLYVNGELKQTVTTTASYAADVLDVSNFVVGGTAQQGPTRSGNDDNRYWFLGNMKDLALYSTALDATEVGLYTAERLLTALSRATTLRRTLRVE